MPGYVIVLAAADRIGLSRRERDVLALVVGGRDTKRMARELGIAGATVRSHVASLVLKVGAANRTQLCLRAVEIGLLARAEEDE